MRGASGARKESDGGAAIPSGATDGDDDSSADADDGANGTAANCCARGAVDLTEGGSSDDDCDGEGDGNGGTNVDEGGAGDGARKGGTGG